MDATNVHSIQKKRCCLNCKHLVQFPRGNSYGDIDYLCIKTGYFVVNVGADVKKIKRYTPGGKELVCCHESSRQKDKEDKSMLSLVVNGYKFEPLRKLKKEESMI